jgi:hypothetical protein
MYPIAPGWSLRKGKGRGLKRRTSPFKYRRKPITEDKGYSPERGVQWIGK